MARGAKNHRILEQAAAEPRQSPTQTAERRDSRDRRDPQRAHLYAGTERRRGARRATDLPKRLRDRPLATILAAALGVAAALAVGSSSPDSSSGSIVLGVTSAPLPSAVDPEQLAEVQAIRDAAEALTPAGVTLDERAADRWMPIVAEIEGVRGDPSTPRAIRKELEATLAALERVGLLGEV